MLPSQIKVGKTRYTVVKTKDFVSANIRGSIRYKDKLIKVRPQTVTREAQTFFHELTHAILHDMGHKLYKDELFVEAFSSRLSAAIKSAKFDETDSIQP